MRDDNALKIVRRLRDRGQIDNYCNLLVEWLKGDLDQGEGESSGGPPPFTRSRAKAVLRAADSIDEATLQDFFSLVESEPGARVALYDLLNDSQLADEEAVGAITANAAALASGIEEGSQPNKSPSWLALAIGGYAWKSGYPLYQLDPSNPPDIYSPAGQVLKRAAHFIRRQVQRSATERDKLNKSLSQPPADAPTLDELNAGGQVEAPLPPHYRPPIPVNYPEVAPDTLAVDPADAPPANTVTRGEPLVITEEELAENGQPASEPIRMPAITIEPESVVEETTPPPSPMPSSAVVVPSSSSQTRPNFTVALKQMLGQEELKSTKLKVIVQKYPDGPGLYGLQVRVTSKGVKSYVAGTTDREGVFVCELPVRLQSGLTYDVEVTWPRDAGGDVERKSITLNADRTDFSLPFYRGLNPPVEASGGGGEEASE